MLTLPPGTHWTVCWIPGLELEGWASSETQPGPGSEFRFQIDQVSAAYTMSTVDPGSPPLFDSTADKVILDWLSVETKKS